MGTRMSFEELDKKIDDNYNKIMENMNRLHSHEEKINKNTGALEILKTFKEDSHRFFIMWLVTFLAFLSLLGYVIYLSNDIRTVTTQEVEQETDEGSNFYVGRDGDING